MDLIIDLITEALKLHKDIENIIGGCDDNEYIEFTLDGAKYRIEITEY